MRETSRSIRPGRLPARLALPLLAILLALGLVGPVSAAADAVQAHHGNAPHHVSALVAPAVSGAGADRHAEHAGLLPAPATAPGVAALHHDVAADRARQSRASVGQTSRGPPTRVDA